MVGNSFNWIALYRAMWVFTNPGKFFLALLRMKAPAQMVVRSPTGNISVSLRNFESLKTLFSIFCRQDYLTSSEEVLTFLDVGANVGIASAYFLSRNPNNRVVCFEPDVENLRYLRQNLLDFGSRVEIRERAISVATGELTLYRSVDGKYSSLIPSARAVTPQVAAADAFGDVLTDLCNKYPNRLVIKLDVEGMEVDLVKSVEFEHFPRISRLICESRECARWVFRKHRLTIRTDYIEDLCFLD